MNIAKSLAGALPFCVALAFGIPLVSAKEPVSGADLARQLNQAFIDVAERVSPCVVVIRVAHRPDAPEINQENNPFFDMVPELRKEWEDKLKKYHRRSTKSAPVFDGEGSGVVIREDGYILTNSHVVEGAEKIVVRLQDGKEYDTVEVKGVDPQSDVAVLKINARGLPSAKLGDSSRTRVGEFAIAIGAPYQLDYSVTVGHVSAKGRRVFSDQVMIDQDFLQTDASINPGNSGGPLVNIDGEVIGINTLIRGMNRGIGFAVPINLAREVGEKLIQDGKFTRAWLGIGIDNLAAYKAYQRLAPGVKEGVVVVRVVPDGPAAGSELQPADVITAVDGKPTTTVSQLKNEIRLKPIGQPVTLNVVRGEKQMKLKVSPAELPEDNAEVAQVQKAKVEDTSREVGLKVQTLTRDLAKQFKTSLKTGVIVTEVESESAAERSGIKPGDIITDVDRKKVTTAQEFKDALKTVDLKEGAIINLTGEAGRGFVLLKDSGD